MANNRPQGRRKTYASGGSGVHRRGSGLGSGPVGHSSGEGNRGGGYGTRSRGGLSSLLIIILVVIFGGGTGLTSLLGGFGSSSDYSSYQYSNSSYSSWDDDNTGVLNTKVASGSRDKYTTIKGDGKDTVTMLVYMCGTDLESKSAMATKDLQEMLNAKTGKNINLLVYTGGCTRWQNNTISSSVNQIYQIKNGKFTCLESNMGTAAMTNPDTLASFIQYGKKNYKANRYELILWDHGGGSVSGYGYDEKNTSSGSMDLSKIQTALKKGGLKFDFIGFDACLMATVENARMLSDYADYLIASEETEPGVGWYYTNWLNTFGDNTSTSTLDLGKEICDDFVSTCAKDCPGQKTTLSLIDLAEVENTIGDPLTDFSKSITSLLKKKEYSTVSSARTSARSFATGNKIDQVDLTDLAQKLDTDEGNDLADAVKSAIKYNKTSSNMTYSYGLSIYFPYESTSYVDRMVSTYDEIGMDEEYSKCIQNFASVEASGQASYGGSSVSQQSLLSSLGLNSSYSGLDSQVMEQLLTQFLTSSASSFLSGRTITNDEIRDNLSASTIDDSQLNWYEEDGQYILEMSEEQWESVSNIDMSMYYDDGSGYIDLGLDNVFDWDDDGNMIADTDMTWVSINGQPVAYYHVDTQENGDEQIITGRVPAYLNGTRVNLIIVFDQEHPEGYIAGANTDYQNETLTQAKNLVQLEVGDTLDFLCDYYSYSGEYQDSYYLGNSITVTDDMEIANTDVGGSVKIVYQLTDIYNQTHYTAAIEY